MTTDILASLALGAIALYALVTLVGRSALQWLRTGSAGFRGVHGAAFSPQWWAGVLMALACVGFVVAPIVVMVAAPSAASPARLFVGGGVFVLGFAFTVIAQLSMGDSWRIGVQQGETTSLCTEGVFAWCRNPVFTGMLGATLGIAICVPLAAVAWLSLWLGLQLQVRIVEEPHLVQVHGAEYERYAAATGRFLPGLGKSYAQ